MNQTTFKKAPFRVLATLIAVEALLIGQQLTKPTPAYAQEKKTENCKAITNPIQERDCWVRKVKAGEKNLKGANLSGADLAEANLSRMNLTDANLSRADLRWAKLNGAELSFANLSGANLSRANLTEANLSGANLTEADLRGTNLGGADLGGADLTGIKKNEYTKGL